MDVVVCFRVVLSVCVGGMGCFHLELLQVAHLKSLKDGLLVLLARQKRSLELSHWREVGLRSKGMRKLVDEDRGMAENAPRQVDEKHRVFLAGGRNC